MGWMNGVDVNDRLVRTEGIARFFVRFDEVPPRLRVDLGRRGLRLLPVEADPVHQLDETGFAILHAKTIEDEFSDFGGGLRERFGRSGAKFVGLRLRERTSAALQVEGIDRFNAGCFISPAPSPKRGIIEVENLRDLFVTHPICRAAEGHGPVARRIALRDHPSQCEGSPLFPDRRGSRVAGCPSRIHQNDSVKGIFRKLEESGYTQPRCFRIATDIPAGSTSSVRKPRRS